MITWSVGSEATVEVGEGADVVFDGNADVVGVFARVTSVVGVSDDTCASGVRAGDWVTVISGDETVVGARVITVLTVPSVGVLTGVIFPDVIVGPGIFCPVCRSVIPCVSVLKF